MNIKMATVGYITLRVMQRSAFILALSLIAGIVDGFIQGPLAVGATFFTSVLFCGVVGFLPFGIDSFGIPMWTSRVRYLVLLETFIAAIVIYVVAMAVLRELDSAEFNRLRNPRAQYILFPIACYFVVVFVMVISLALSHFRHARQ